MNITTTIIGLAILMLFIAPVILFMRNSKRKTGKLIDRIHAEALKSGLTIDESDSWNETAIGIDDKNGKVICVDISHGEEDIRIISLKDLKSVRCTPDVSLTNNKKTDYRKESRLSITFSFREASRSDYTITFFIAGFGSLSKKQEELFEKWGRRLRKITV